MDPDYSKTDVEYLPNGGWGADDRVAYYVDGELLAFHSAEVAPEVPMSINFNLWFMPKGADG